MPRGSKNPEWLKNRPKTKPGKKKNYKFEGLAPLKFAPEKVAESLEKQAKIADKSMRAAIKIKCIECSGWSRVEAKACRIKSCALFPWNRKIFDKKSLEVEKNDA